MRYVAFIDTLGFKSKISRIDHNQAKDVIKLFNQTIYNLWRELGLNQDDSIRGRTFSDSLIIHTQQNSVPELNKLLSFIVELYRLSITQVDLPLRGGLAIGEFDDIRAVEFNNLQKGLIVGSAFIDAYLLESTKGIKGSKLVFGQEVNLQIERRLKNYQTQKVKTESSGKSIYELKWGDLVFLSENNYIALNKYIDLAIKSKWLDHYYGTLETFLIKESPENRKEIYIRIIERIKADYRYRDLDLFIENYVKSESAPYTKRSFLSFLREKL